MEFSIIIPVYNRTSKALRCLISLMALKAENATAKIYRLCKTVNIYGKMNMKNSASHKYKIT